MMKSFPFAITGELWPGKSTVQSAAFASILSGKPVSRETPVCSGPRQSSHPCTPFAGAGGFSARGAFFCAKQKGASEIETAKAKGTRDEVFMARKRNGRAREKSIHAARVLPLRSRCGLVKKILTRINSPRMAARSSTARADSAKNARRHTETLPRGKGEPKRLPPLLRRAWYGLNQAFRQRITHLGITPDQYSILRWLSEGDPQGLTQRVITDLMASDPNTITSTLSRMERAGLVSRHPHELDRRAHRVRLQASGRRSFEKARKI